MKSVPFVLAAMLSATFGGLVFGGEIPPLSLEAHIDLPEVRGRIDHLSADVEGNRIFIAAVENGTVEIVDVKSHKRVHTIRDLSEPQGVLYEPSTRSLFVASGDGTVKIFEGKSFQLLTTVVFPDDADNIRLDSNRGRVIVGYAGAKQLRKGSDGVGGLAFLDFTGKVLGQVVIDAHPESFQIDNKSERIYVNVPDKKEIEVIDASKLTVLAKWPVTDAAGNFPMALDPGRHRLLIGTWTPSTIQVRNQDDGTEISSTPITGRSDDMFVDVKLERVYALATDGFLDAFDWIDAAQLKRIAHIPTPKGTQTGLFVPEWNRLFAVVRSHDGKIAELRDYFVHK